METVANVPHFGGSLCLDFTNTVEPRNGERPKDLLAERDDVIRFGVRYGLSAAPPRPRRTKTTASAAAAEEELARARSLREAVYTVVKAVSERRNPDEQALAHVQAAFAQAMARSELVVGGDEFEWRSKAEGVDLVLDAVARDAVDLLRSRLHARIKQCGRDGEGCGWLFLDTTKSGTRRWCSMAVCGSRAKATRQRSRKH